MAFWVVGCVVMLTIVALVTRKAWRTTAEMWPLDTEFPNYFQDAAPVRGRWLAIALRVLTFPMVLFAYTCLGMVLVLCVCVALAHLIGRTFLSV